MNSPGSSHFHFWQQWLFYSSLGFAFMALAYAAFGHSFLFAPYNQMLAEVFWHQSQLPPEAERFRAFVAAPFGGTMACCYILLAFIAHHPFKNKEVWARQAILVGFGFWVVVDSAGCLYFGVYPQLYLINAFSILVKALPLIFTWKSFRTPANTRAIAL